MDTILTVDEIQVLVSELFGVRDNIIVPNVSWGFFETHEADVVVINKSNYLTEIEIKRSWSDFRKDFKKTTTHDEGKVMWKYFAVPDSILKKVAEYLTINGRKDWGVIAYNDLGGVWIVSHPKNQGNTDPKKKLFIEERLAIARLGCMRVWKLKSRLEEARQIISKLNKNTIQQ